MKNVSIVKVIFISIVIGILSGISIGIFLLLLEKSIELNLKYAYLVYVLPISGVIMTYLYEAYGGNSKKGNNIIIENINGSREEIEFIMAPLVFMGTILTHLFGGSVGREGTGVQIGGTIGSFLCRLFKSNIEERKIVLISGVSAGFSAVFGTPIVGLIFALEVSNIGSLSYKSMIPAMTAAIIGDKVCRTLGVKHTQFMIPSVESTSFNNFFKVILMAICFGLASRLFVYMTRLFKEVFNRYIKNSYVKIFIGGSLMVIATLIIGNRLYNNLSLGLLSDAFTGNIPYDAFIIKLILTTLCLAAGYQGGEVTPLFVIGATLGSVLSFILGVPTAFAAALGLVAVFSGATKTPIASFMMYLELFGSVNIIFAMIVCIISIFVSGKKGIYSSQIWSE